MMRIFNAKTVNDVELTVPPSGTSSRMTDTMYRTLSNSTSRAVCSASTFLVADGGRRRRRRGGRSTSESGNGDEMPKTGPSCREVK